MRYSLYILAVFAALTLSSTAVAQTTVLGGNVVNETWTRTGSPYTVLGDVTVPVGAFLRLEAGVEVRFAESDGQRSGEDTSTIELTVRGTLTVSGTAAEPVWFHAQRGTGTRTWYGIVAAAGSSVTVDGATISNARVGVLFTGDGSVSRSTFSTCDYGVGMYGGNATVDSSVFTTSRSGVFASSGVATLRNCTLVRNELYGAHAQGGFIVVVGSIVVSNGSYGLVRSAGGLSYTDSDVWDNAVLNVVSGGRNISANPQFVSAVDFHLMRSSVCIDAAGSTGAPLDFDGVSRPVDGDGIGGALWDMGAYEFVRPAVCGDGAVGAGELCDDGARNGTYGFCRADCSGLGPRCGNGVTDGPETCDDGNTVETDSCLNACVLARCGDGVTQMGVEQCDDGNDSNIDACVNTCALAACGDGYVGPDEDCDDGNTDDMDACSNACMRRDETSDAGMLGWDAGATDAGCDNDAGMLGWDAGATDADIDDNDAGRADAGSAPDAGGGVPVDGGCACRVNHRNPGGLAALIGVGFVLALRRRFNARREA